MACDSVSPIFIALVASFCAASDSLTEKRVHESRYDIGKAARGDHWKLEGSAEVSGTGFDLVSKNEKFGAVWNEEPVDFSNWEFELDFEISRREPNGVHADGLGFFYVRDREFGKTFGTIPEFVGLGIVFDTFRNGALTNTQLPYLQAHVLNGSVPHSWEQDGIPTALVNLHAPAVDDLNSRLIMKYQCDSLAVTFKYRRGYYFVLGASCGKYCSNHRILGLNVYSLDVPDRDTLSLPLEQLAGSLQDNQYFRWNSLDKRELSSGAIVLGYTRDARPIYFVRAVDQGRIIPALYIPSIDEENLFAFANAEITAVGKKGAEILSHRYSRSSHLLWQQYPTQRLESVEFRERLVAVGYSDEGDVLSICRSEPPDAENPPERSFSSGLGVFSISSGVCRYVNQINSTNFEVRTTSQFSMSLTLPIDAS